MSLDIYLMRVQETELTSQNITHNLRDLWIALGVYDVLYNSEGKLAIEITAQIQEAINNLEPNLDYYKQFDSPNGWGIAENGLRFLKDLWRDLDDYPNAKVHISR